VSAAEAALRRWPEQPGAAAQVWRRLRGQRLAIVCGAFIVAVVLACFVGEPVAERVLGHGPNDIFPHAVGDNLKPVGPWTRVPTSELSGPVGPHARRTLLILGAADPLGRDQFLRLLAGGRTSLEIALGATALAIVIAALSGALTAFYGGLADSAFSRLTEFVMGFPILFFVVALGLTVANRLNAVTLGGLVAPGVLSLIAVIGLFNWFYLARVVRAQVLSLREQEFVEAARMIGGGNVYIVRRHILPHLTSTLIVYGSLIVAATMILEAGLSLLNLGIEVPYASWGNMLSTNWGTLLVPTGAPSFTQTASLTTAAPAAAIFTTVLAFALFGEGLRRALDPHAEVRV
jgi:peptide/nickel transport system permease protein